MHNKFYTFFIICFIILFGLILTYNLYNNFVGLIVCFIIQLLLIFLVYKKRHIFTTIFKNKYVKYLVIIIPIIIRVILIFLNYPSPVSDEATFYDVAKTLSIGEKAVERYIATFPYLYGYISFLSYIFKLFGISIKSAILFNVILDLIGALFCFMTLKKISSKKMAYIGLIIWLYNPMNIIWCTKILPVIIVNVFLIITMYVFMTLTKNFDNKKRYLYSGLTGLCLGITNCFRPIMIIFIIAVILYYVYLFLQQKKLVYLMSSLILIIIPYILIGIINTKIVENYSGYKIEGSSGGWSLYVGSNYQSEGVWFEDKDFSKQLYSDDFSPSKLHNFFTVKAINNYKNNGLKNFILLLKKGKVLSSNNNEYTYDAFTAKNVNKVCRLILKLYIDFTWYFSIILILVSSIKRFYKKDDNILLAMVLILGFFGSNLFVEVSPRYFTPCLVPITLIMAYYIYNIFDIKKEGDKK